MTAQREWLDKDFYKVLGVSKDASAKEIKSEYRKLSRKYHPDANPDNPKAEDRFKEISAAYDVLGDETKRKEYDDIRRLGPLGGAFGGGGGPGPGAGGFNFDPSGVGDIGDLLGGLFGRGGAGRQQGRQRGAGSAQKGRDLETTLHLSFEDAVHGITTAVNLVSEAQCETCRGSGSKPGSRASACGQCHGQGVVDDNQGMFSFSRPCPMCSGRGVLITDPCNDCSGNGTTRRPRDIKVRIPAGVKNGQRIKVKGRGEPGAFGGPAGDLFVVIDVAAHGLFGRKAKHLTINAPVTFAEAALGTKITVPTLEGDTVTLKVPAGTKTGQTFRVKGRGVKSKKSTGDLLVTVEVDVPAELTDKQREALEAYAAATSDSPRAHFEER